MSKWLWIYENHISELRIDRWKWEGSFQKRTLLKRQEKSNFKRGRAAAGESGDLTVIQRTASRGCWNDLIGLAKYSVSWSIYKSFSSGLHSAERDVWLFWLRNQPIVCHESITDTLVSVKIAQSRRFAFSNEPLGSIISCCLGNESVLRYRGTWRILN